MSRHSTGALAVYGTFGSRTWLPFTVRDEASLDHLNALLSDGWYLPDLGQDRPHFPVYYIVETPGLRAQRPVEGALPSGVPMLMLTRAERPGMQIALVMPRNTAGYSDLGALASALSVDTDSWEPRVLFSVGRALSVAIVERKGG